MARREPTAALSRTTAAAAAMNGCRAAGTTGSMVSLPCVIYSTTVFSHCRSVMGPVDVEALLGTIVRGGGEGLVDPTVVRVRSCGSVDGSSADAPAVSCGVVEDGPRKRSS